MKIAATFAVIVAAVAITALGVYVGWAMDHSHVPPSGGGWRCYRDCIAIIWAIPLSVGALASLPRFCRWLTCVRAA